MLTPNATAKPDTAYTHWRECGLVRPRLPSRAEAPSRPAAPLLRQRLTIACRSTLQSDTHVTRAPGDFILSDVQSNRLRVHDTGTRQTSRPDSESSATRRRIILNQKQTQFRAHLLSSWPPSSLYAQIALANFASRFCRACRSENSQSL